MAGAGDSGPAGSGISTGTGPAAESPLPRPGPRAAYAGQPPPPRARTQARAGDPAPRGGCQARVGWYDRPPAESLAGAWGCPDEATVTLRGTCVHEHVREKSFCAAHGRLDPADAVWLCASCAEAGHDCPMAVTVVPPERPPAPAGAMPPPGGVTSARPGRGIEGGERAAQRDTWARAQAAHKRAQRPYRGRGRGVLPPPQAGMHRHPPPPADGAA